FCYFFFQAEDGIRDFHVTGVQTCALPISITRFAEMLCDQSQKARFARCCKLMHFDARPAIRPPDNLKPMSPRQSPKDLLILSDRSEERRVGKECRSRRSRHSEK